jgi:nicotinate phosphoribosyltransferase
MTNLHDFSSDACLLTDFYQFTMAQAYFDQRRHEIDAVFHLFFRKNPFTGNWTIAAGIGDALDFVENFRVSADAISYLSSLHVHDRAIFSEDFLDYLSSNDARIDVVGVSDGQLVFPNEPILRVRGPLFLCQLLETPLLNIVNFQSLIATKASRVRMAAKDKMVMDFGLRRAQGFDGAITATKAAFIGGIDATSNVWAAKHFAIAPSGTQAHSFIMSYDSQLRAFDDFCSSFKDNAVLLVDTYDPIKGIDDAIAAFNKLRARGHRPSGIRLDSGDVGHLSRLARNELDRAGFRDCKIIVSGDLDEYAIEKLENDRAPVDAYGVGTRLVTAHDDPALTGVYKLASVIEHGAVRDTAKTYLSDKLSWPGHLAIMRYKNMHELAFDVIYDERRGITSPLAKPFVAQDALHMPLMQGKKKLVDQSLAEKRGAAAAALASLPKEWKSLKKANGAYPVYFDGNIAHKGATGETSVF